MGRVTLRVSQSCEDGLNAAHDPTAAEVLIVRLRFGVYNYIGSIR